MDVTAARPSEAASAPAQANAAVRSGLKPGDKIRGTTGYFSEFDGVVKSVTADGTVEANFDVFGLPTQATVSANGVVKL